jgi:formylglycine-generating enzyme required for sulfatase activity
MKMLILVLVTVLGLASLANAATRGIEVVLKSSEAQGAPDAGTVRLYGASYALVIGIDEYTNGWQRLYTAVEDARRIAKELRGKGFEVTLKLNLKADQMRTAMREFFAKKGKDPQARLLLWYAGHGHTIDGEGYLVPADAPTTINEDDFLLKALPMRDFGSLTRLARSKHVLSIFDSCFSGTVFQARASATPRAITKKTTKPVRQFITSGDAGQQVRDDGSFREYFIRALNGEERADFNNDGYVTGEELGLFLTQQMSALTSAAQTPKAGKLHDVRFNQGDFVFVLPGEAPKPETSGMTPEMLFWQSIQSSTNPASFDAYLSQYPKGAFAALARVKIAELKATKTAALTPVPKVVAPKSSPSIQSAVGTYFTPGKTFKDCDDCPEMVVIPAGGFMMGSPDSEHEWFVKQGAKQEWVDWETPRHPVDIKYKFAVGKHEITKGQFAAFIKNTDYNAGDKCYLVSTVLKDGVSWKAHGFSQDKDHPVVCVDWKAAKAYVEWLSRKTGQKYRLLSESEWEYVARAGTDTMRYWGHDWDNKDSCQYANMQDKKIGLNKIFKCDDGAKYTRTVGAYRRNAFGLHDMLGNVGEWTEDCWNKNYNEAPTDGTARTIGNCSKRVLRGASWANDPSHLRSAKRGWNVTSTNAGFVGFRIARTLPNRAAPRPASLTPPAQSIEPLDETYVVVKTANVRSKPDAKSTKVTTLRLDTGVQVTGRTKDGKWLRIAHSGGDAFIWGSLIKPIDAAELSDWAGVKGSRKRSKAEGFLNDHPSGHFAAHARRIIASLTPLPKAAAPNPSPSVQPVVGVFMRPGKVFRDCAECPEMVVIPAGSFRMGDLNGDGDSDEKPVHRVTIPRALAVGKYEVTQAEWRSVMRANPSAFYRDRNAVTYVNWKDAKAFVRKLSAKTGKEYRLLSEAEWEYAARSRSTTRYSWGVSFSLTQAYLISVAGAIRGGALNRRTKRVGNYAANGFGLHDMHGNVWEWTEDCWNIGYDGAPSDGTARTTGDCSYHVQRGGSLLSIPKNLRSSHRGWDKTMNLDSFTGFRIARTL